MFSKEFSTRPDIRQSNCEPNPPQATVSTPNENTNVADIDWLEIDPHEISDNQLVDVLTQIEVSNVNLAVPSTSTSNPQNSANNYNKISVTLCLTHRNYQHCQGCFSQILP